MRRGRPTKTDSPPPPANLNTQPAATNTDKSFDPFDPSHVRNNSVPKATIPQTNTPPESGFQNSFTPEEVPPRVQSAPLTTHTTSKPQMATKILQTQPSSPLKSNQMDQLAQEEDTNNEQSPKMNRGVSSSIEARFMAIKNASRNSTPIKPTSPSTSTTKKSKPAPPPKPARFRSSAATKPAAPTEEDFEHKFPTLEELDKSLTP